MGFAPTSAFARAACVPGRWSRPPRRAMVLFSNKQEANLRVCIKMVEDAISVLGHVPDDSRIEGPEPDMPAWKVQKGSAHVFVYLGIHGDENVLRVLAPVLHMASNTDELSLYRHLLELNCRE